MADHSAFKKPKVTAIKKSDSSHKSSKAEKSQLSFDKKDEEILVTLAKGDEPYKCSGKFIEDFQNVCKQNQINYIPQIIHRNKQSNMPHQNIELKASEINTINNKQKQTKVKQNLSLLEPQNDSIQQTNVHSNQGNQKNNSILSFTEDENFKDEQNENLPKTFILVKDMCEYFKPKIQYDAEHHDKQDYITELFIRGWKIEANLMNVLQETMPFSEKLTSINFWNCGLNDETLETLACFLPKCVNIRNVILDGNPTNNEDYYKLIEGNSLIQHLSLRSCNITEKGAEKLGIAIGNVNEQNSKLISLNLSGNRLGDLGAIEIAKGLRTNRTLLVLNLACNEIGDKGAINLAETLSRFKMTHEEIVKRRMIKRDRILKELALNPRIIKTDSNVTGQTSRALKEMIKSGKNRNDLNSATNQTKDKAKNKDLQSGRDSSHDKINSKSGGSGPKDAKKDALNQNPGSASIQKKDKEKSKEINNTPGTSGDKTKSGSKPKSPKKSNKVELDQLDSDVTRSGSAKMSCSNTFLTNICEPLIEEIENIDGDLWIVGNRTLLSLNLSRNKLSCLSLKKFLFTIGYQNSFNSKIPTGLLKLNLYKNDFHANHEDFIRLNELIKLKDPISLKINEHNMEAISSASKEGFSNNVVTTSGKETSRSKSSRHQN